MRKLIPVLTFALGAMLILTAAPLPAAADEETTRLERWALCHAMPYRCPGYNPAQDEDPSLIQARQTNERCARLAQSRTSANDVTLWQTSCRDWQARQERADGMTAAARRAIARSSSTLDCITTWSEGRYSSRLITTCTSY